MLQLSEPAIVDISNALFPAGVERAILRRDLEPARGWDVVYCIWVDGELMYVGYSAHLYNRVRSHCYAARRFDRPHPTAVSWQPFASKQECLHVEAGVIDRERPPWNTGGPDLRYLLPERV